MSYCRSILQSLVSRLSSGVYGIYEDYLTNEKIESERDLNVSSVLDESDESFQMSKAETKITQACAIQFLFDVQFINNILNCQTDDMKVRFLPLCSMTVVTILTWIFPFGNRYHRS